jgi:hypothetical protein
MSVGIDFTTAALITGARRRSGLPSSQQLYLDPDFIAFLNDAMVSHVVPTIKSVSEEYFVVNYDVAFVAGTSEYVIPTRALGGALRDIVIADTQGRELEIPRVQPESIKYSGNFQNFGAYGIYLRGDRVVFYPPLTNTPQNSSLRFKYERRPNDLCLVSAAGLIQSINATAKTITLASIPTAWGTSTTLDIISQVPQFPSIADDVVITLIAGTTITLATWPTGIAAGQWVAESLTSPIAQLPYEGHKLLQQLGAIALLEAAGDTQGKQNAEQTLKGMIDNFMKVITPRIEGSPKKVVNKNSIFGAIPGCHGSSFTRP